jgi:hypothetical protein
MGRGREAAGGMGILMTPLERVREAMGPSAWWSVTEGRQGRLWTVGVEGKDPHALDVRGIGATLEAAIAAASTPASRSRS